MIKESNLETLNDNDFLETLNDNDLKELIKSYDNEINKTNTEIVELDKQFNRLPSNPAEFLIKEINKKYSTKVNNLRDLRIGCDIFKKELERRGKEQVLDDAALAKALSETDQQVLKNPAEALSETAQQELDHAVLAASKLQKEPQPPFNGEASTNVIEDSDEIIRVKPGGLLFHEPQVDDQCAMHAINNAFQVKVVGNGRDGALFDMRQFSINEPHRRDYNNFDDTAIQLAIKAYDDVGKDTFNQCERYDLWAPVERIKVMLPSLKGEKSVFRLRIVPGNPFKSTSPTEATYSNPIDFVNRLKTSGFLGEPPFKYRIIINLGDNHWTSAISDGNMIRYHDSVKRDRVLFFPKIDGLFKYLPRERIFCLFVYTEGRHPITVINPPAATRPRHSAATTMKNQKLSPHPPGHATMNSNKSSRRHHGVAAPSAALTPASTRPPAAATSTRLGLGLLAARLGLARHPTAAAPAAAPTAAAPAVTPSAPSTAAPSTRRPTRVFDGPKGGKRKTHKKQKKPRSRKIRDRRPKKNITSKSI